MANCDTCSGRGQIVYKDTCPKCSGTGAGGWDNPGKNCGRCRGSGKVAAKKTCHICNGSGEK